VISPDVVMPGFESVVESREVCGWVEGGLFLFTEPERLAVGEAGACEAVSVGVFEVAA
jgi:hypothetical protein